MNALRRQIRIHPGLAALIFAAAMFLRVLVPAGFMPDFSSGKFTMTLCSGYGPEKMMMDMPGMDHGKSGGDHHGKAEMPCGFSGLSTPSLAGADPIQLALAVIGIIAAALLIATPFVVARVARLRPPLRGPPAAA